MTFTRARHQGYLRALTEAGIKPEPRFHRTGEMTEGVGLRETIRLLESKSRKPTAFIAGNPLIAKGIYTAVQAFGLSVPDDISVVAHDDKIPELNLATFEPTVTCTRSSIEHSSEPLSRFLVGALNKRPISQLQQIEIPELIQRDSVGPCCD